MIKCPNCSFENIDGTLLCEQCFWDIAMVEMTPGEPAGGGVPAAAPAEAPLGDMPLAEAPLAEAPMGEMPMEAAPADLGLEAAPAADMPLEAAISAEGAPVDVFAELPMGEAAAVEAPMEEAPPADAALGLEAGLAPEGLAEMPAEGLAEMPAGEAPAEAAAPAEGMGEVSALEAAADLAAPAPAEEAPAARSTKGPVMSPFPPARPVPEGAQPKLMIVRGAKPNAEYAIVEGANFIGRFDELPVDVDLTDQEEKGNMRSSRQHACITFESQMLQLEDLNSANGTYLNRIKINPGDKVPLSVGDYIQTGTVMFRVKT